SAIRRLLAHFGGPGHRAKHVFRGGRGLAASIAHFLEMTMSVTNLDAQLEFVSSDGRGPVLFRAPANKTDSYVWLRENLPLPERVLLQHGGLVLRDFGLNS